MPGSFGPKILIPNEPGACHETGETFERETTPGEGGDAAAYGIVVRRSARGWQVGDEQAADLTSAMVLADLLATDLGSGRTGQEEAPGAQARRLAPARPPGQLARPASTAS